MNEKYEDLEKQLDEIISKMQDEKKDIAEIMSLYKKGQEILNKLESKVKDIKEAFKEYPVENEFHKGKIENVLKEENLEYSYYKIGDIVFVKKYEYENGKEGNNHLFVIIDQNNFAIPIESFGMIISSQLKKLKYKTNK